jgi:putative DNA-invertase from lambdoid prophage Rac
MVFTVIGAVAELERSLIQERVVMGLSRARKQGTRLGRPRVSVDAAKVSELRAHGRTWAEISQLLRISRGRPLNARFTAWMPVPPGRSQSRLILF